MPLSLSGTRRPPQLPYRGTVHSPNSRPHEPTDRNRPRHTHSWKVRRRHVGLSSELKVLKVPELSPVPRLSGTTTPLQRDAVEDVFTVRPRPAPRLCLRAARPLALQGGARRRAAAAGDAPPSTYRRRVRARRDEDHAARRRRRRRRGASAGQLHAARCQIPSNSGPRSGPYYPPLARWCRLPATASRRDTNASTGLGES